MHFVITPLPLFLSHEFHPTPHLNFLPPPSAVRRECLTIMLDPNEGADEVNDAEGVRVWQTAGILLTCRIPDVFSAFRTDPRLFENRAFSGGRVSFLYFVVVVCCRALPRAHVPQLQTHTHTHTRTHTHAHTHTHAPQSLLALGTTELRRA